ncbi:hypothetical protein JOC86_001938 [Bacillus pakistanensis]|uniref:Uncharacterized protein n=1 Tax=Rossellomorea pakistanensis TaxID=992288 RepID=A0ABS2NC30_9BACI|nr:hypothetical protein [Bacillus pakistanensis]
MVTRSLLPYGDLLRYNFVDLYKSSHHNAHKNINKSII